jgi:hypothetical protein
MRGSASGALACQTGCETPLPSVATGVFSWREALRIPAATRILFQGVVVVALACAPCLAQAEGWKLDRKELHPWVIIKGPGILSAWKKAVSSAKVPKQEQYWVQDMEGPGSADIVTGAGARELVVGNTCRPHDCYDNNLVFAIDLANKQIWGLRQGRGQSPKAKQFIGGPDAETQQLLLQELAKEAPDQ